MTTKQKLLQLVQDTTIDFNAWGDHFVEEGDALAEQLSVKEYKECLTQNNELSNHAFSRLLGCLLEIENHTFFENYLQIAQHADYEIQETIIDGLRCWNLDKKQKRNLKEFAISLKGKSGLLGKIIDCI